MLGGGQFFSPLFLKTEILLSPSLITKDRLLTAAYRAVFRISPIACDHKPDYRACARSVFSDRASAISVLFYQFCMQGSSAKICVSLFLTEAVGRREEGRVGRQTEYLSDGEKVIGGEEHAAGGGYLTVASLKSSVAWIVEEWLLLRRPGAPCALRRWQSQLLTADCD